MRRRFAGRGSSGGGTKARGLGLWLNQDRVHLGADRKQFAIDPLKGIHMMRRRGRPDRDGQRPDSKLVTILMDGPMWIITESGVKYKVLPIVTAVRFERSNRLVCRSFM